MGLFFSEKKVHLPPEDQIPNLVSELEAYSYEILASGKIQYGAPAGKHDDEVMSLGLAIWGLKDKLETGLFSIVSRPTLTPNLDPFSNEQYDRPGQTQSPNQNGI
jgi:hypothetical protein